jgi:hypothetical protein
VEYDRSRNQPACEQRLATRNGFRISTLWRLWRQQAELVRHQRRELGRDHIRSLYDPQSDPQIDEVAHLGHTDIVVPIGDRAVASERLKSDVL